MIAANSSADLDMAGTKYVRNHGKALRGQIYSCQPGGRAARRRGSGGAPPPPPRAMRCVALANCTCCIVLAARLLFIRTGSNLRSPATSHHECICWALTYMKSSKANNKAHHIMAAAHLVSRMLACARARSLDASSSLIINDDDVRACVTTATTAACVHARRPLCALFVACA